MKRLILLLFCITTAVSAHVDGVDEKGGHWYYRLGVYHQHWDFEGSSVDGTYKEFIDTEDHLWYKLKFMRVGLRTYKIGNRNHALSIQSGWQTDSQFKYGRQWTIGVNYRIRHSQYTRMTYSVDWYKVNDFTIVDYSVIWGIYYPKFSKNWSYHTGILLSTANDWNSNMGAWIHMLEWDIGIATLAFRYDYYSILSVWSTGVTYNF